MNAKNDFFSDDLNDLLSGPATPAPRQLPQDESFARIRASGIGHAPVAKVFEVTCQKCCGTGRFISYSGRALGPCYACKGNGKFERKTNPTVLASNREKAAERKVKSAQANWDAFLAAYPAHAAVLIKGQKANSEKWASICHEIIGKVRSYGDLHQGTMDMLQRAVDRDAQWAAQRAQAAVQTAPAAPALDVSKIVDAFQRAQQAGLKRFKLRFSGVFFEQDKHDQSKIWVSESGYGSAKYGLIEVGVYKAGRAVTAEVRALIAEVAADPLAAGIAYAQATASCSVCGRHLENQDSVDAGIGPVCAGRLNRPGLKFVEAKAGVDF